MKKFVIAGTSHQANHWIKADLDKRSKAGETTLSWSEYVAVTDATRMRGISNPHGVFVGTWRERYDIKHIVETLMIQSIHPNAALDKIWKELNENNLPTP